MACKGLEKLETDWNRALTEVSYFTRRENRSLRQISDRQAKPFARAAREKVADMSQQIISHQQVCQNCKGEPQV